MFKNAETNYDQMLPIAELYRKTVRGEATEDDIKKLSKNFTVTGRTLIKFKGEIKLERSENVGYDNRQFSYFALEPGYVLFEDKKISVLPFFHLDESKSICTAIVPSRLGTSEALTMENVAGMVSEMKFQQRPGASAMEEITARYLDGRGGASELIRGVLPQNGRSALVDMIYESKSSQVGTADRMGNIDFKEKNYVNNVSRGEVIAKFTPEIKGVSGTDVFGHEVSALLEVVDTHRRGSGLVLLDDGVTLAAEVDGVLHISPTKIVSVGVEEIIHGNLDIKIGNINVTGHVRILGNVMPGLEIRATGDVYVAGNLEESSVFCKGDLKVEGGIVGSDKNHIEIGGSLFTDYLRNVNVRAGVDVEISGSVMSSIITCNGRVRAVTEKKGKVIGGSITAFKAIEIQVAGSSAGVKTTLIAGLDINREKRISEIAKEIKANTDNITKLKAALGQQYFQDPQEYLRRLPAAKIPVIKQVIQSLKVCLESKNRLSSEFEDLKNMAADLKSASISFLTNAWDNTSIQIGHSIKNLEKGVVSPTKFIYDNEIKDIIPVSVGKS